MGVSLSITTNQKSESIYHVEVSFLVCIPMFSLAKNLEPINYKPPSKIHYQNEIQMNKITDQMDKMLDLFNTDKTPKTNEKDLNASIDEILTLALDLSELLDNQIKSSSESQDKVESTFGIPMPMLRMRYKRNRGGIDEVPITRMRY